MKKLFIFGIIFVLMSMSVSGLININSCRELNISDTYVLTSNVASSGDCFTIVADNVILECNGNTVSYGTAGFGANAIDASMLIIYK